MRTRYIRDLSIQGNKNSEITTIVVDHPGFTNLGPIELYSLISTLRIRFDEVMDYRNRMKSASPAKLEKS